jgi:hypothetical protein
MDCWPIHKGDVVVTDLLDRQDKLVFESFYSLLTSASSIGAGDVVVTAD